MKAIQTGNVQKPRKNSLKKYLHHCRSKGSSASKAQIAAAQILTSQECVNIVANFSINFCGGYTP